MSRVFDLPSAQYLYAGEVVVVTTPHTLACWAKKPNTIREGTLLTVCDNTDDNQYDCLVVSTTETLAARTQGSANRAAIHGTPHPIDTWFHACGVFATKADRTIYLDGVDPVQNTSNVIQNDFNDLGIGGKPEVTPVDFFGGYVAEAAVWNVTLTAAEVAILAAGYFPWFVRPQNLVFYTDLIRDDDTDLVGGITLTAVNAPTIQTHPPIKRIPPPFLSFPVSAAGQTINVLQVTETDLAQSLSWSPKNRLVDLITETDLAQSVSSLKTAQVALVTETDLAQAVSTDKAKTLGQVLETDLAQSLTSLKLKEIAQTIETDLAQLVGVDKAKVIAQTIETDLAQSIAWNPITRLIGQVTETDLAQIITVLGEQVIPVNQVVETDLAQSILWSPKNRLIGQVLETDFAQIISTTGEIIQSVNQVLETNLAQSILWSPKNRLVDQVVEADLAQTLASLKTAQIGIVSETDLAQVVGIIKSRVLGQVSETDLAQILSSSKLKVIAQVMETDLAQIITVLFGVAQFFRTLNLYGEHIPETAYNLQGEHIIEVTLQGEHIPETDVDLEGDV